MEGWLLRDPCHNNPAFLDFFTRVINENLMIDASI